MSYDDTHRAFLQAFMARGTLTFSEAQPLLASITSAHSGRAVDATDITEDDFQAYISAVSSAVGAFDYEVRSTLHQKKAGRRRSSTQDGEREQGQEGERVYALINSTSDDLTQLATSFNADELAFVKRVLDEMFERNNSLRREVCAVAGRAALQLHGVRDADARRRASAQPNALTQSLHSNSATPAAQDGGGDESQQQQQQRGAAQPISMTQAQAVLDALVAQGWFEKSRKGFYSLSPRALMELRTWLVETYNDEDEDDMDVDGDEDDVNGTGSRRRIKMCLACKDIVTVGQRCPKLTCQARLHDGCTERFFRMQKAELCPICKRDWTGHGYVGEKAANQGSSKSTSAAPSQGSSRRTSGLDGANDDDEEEEEEEADDGE